MRDNSHSLLQIKQRQDVDKAEHFAALKRMEVSVRQIVKEYNIVKGRLTTDVTSLNAAKVDKVLDGIEAERRRVENELERELFGICEQPTQQALGTSVAPSDESFVEEARQSLRQFFDESKENHANILIDKLRLLEKENQALKRELQSTQDLLEARERDMQAERDYSQVLV